MENENLTESKRYNRRKNILKSRYFTRSLYILATICLSIIFYFLVKNIAKLGGAVSGIFSVLLPFIIGFSIAFLLNPILKFAEKHLSKVINNSKTVRVISVVLTLLFAILILWAIVWIITPKLIDSFNELFIVIADSVNKASIYVLDFLSKTNLEDYLTQDQVNSITGYAGQFIATAYETVQKILPQILAITGTFTKTIFAIILGFIVSIYFLTGKEKFSAQIKKMLYSLLSKEKVEKIIDFGIEVNDTFNRYIVGQLIDAVIVGILCFFIMMIIKLPYALLISVIIGITNIIPYFGPFLGAIPSGLILLAIDPKQAIIFLVMIIVIQQIDGNIIAPKILGESTGLSGFWILFAVTIGGAFFNIIGMILGVPIFALIYTSISRFTDKHLENKGLSSNTCDYISFENITKETKPKENPDN